MSEELFIHKYQPLYFNDFDKDNEIVNMLKTLLEMDNLNILLIGHSISNFDFIEL